MIPIDWIQAAAARIAPYIIETHLTYDPDYDLFIKWENHQVTGSFKARGAFNKVLVLEEWEREAGLLAASAGNHGQGVALAGKTFNAPVTIYAAETAVPSKIQAMRDLGAQVILVPGGYGDAEKAGLARAAESDATWISPYNDGQIIAGQGTIGLEILKQLATHSEFQNRASSWIVPASGGGLLSGVGAVLATIPERPRLIGVQADNSPFTHAIFHTGSQDQIEEFPTIADGLAGPVEPNSITIPLIRSYTDDFLLVSEDEIREAIVFSWERYEERIEGAAAAALALAIRRRVDLPSVVIISGGNIQPEVHAKIIGEALNN
jgi:threonine dehydratase